MRCKDQGFSLIEVLITFVLIGIGTLGLIKLQAYIEKQADYAISSVEALNLAEQKLEWFRTRGATVNRSGFQVASYSGDIVSGSEIHGQYTLTWKVSELSGTGPIKAIDIETSWLDRQASKQAVSLQTMISQYSEFEP